MCLYNMPSCLPRLGVYALCAFVRSVFARYVSVAGVVAVLSPLWLPTFFSIESDCPRSQLLSVGVAGLWPLVTQSESISSLPTDPKVGGFGLRKPGSAHLPETHDTGKVANLLRAIAYLC